MTGKEIPIPRPAATVLLLRDGAAGTEVFMVVRHQGMAFASGSRVFPGGRVDDSDFAVAGQPGLCTAVPGVIPSAMAFRVAAIRETFEESGILLARPRGATDLVSAAALTRLEAARAAIHDGSLKFGDMLEREKLVLAADVLVPFAHWITPIVMPKRYDTHFFVAAAPPDQVAAHDGGKSVDSLWISPAAAVADADNDRGKLEFATRMNMLKVGRSATVDAALAAARAAPIVTVEPQITFVEGGRRAKIPLSADYGGDDFHITL